MPRQLQWDGCANVRDLGGYRTQDGGRTRFGSVVRSDNPAFLSQRGWDDLRAYGIRTVVGLRTVGAPDDEPAEHHLAGDVDLVRLAIEDLTDEDFHEKCVQSGLWGTPLYFADVLNRWPERAAAAVQAVARARPGGVLISCGRGCDRTGLLALLLLHLVGVSSEDIASDYGLSRVQLADRAPEYAEDLSRLLERHQTTVEAAIAAVVEDPLLPTLVSGGLGERDVEALRARLVEP